MILQSPTHFITLHVLCAAGTSFKMAFTPSVPSCIGVKASDSRRPCGLQWKWNQQKQNPFFICKVFNESTMQWLPFKGLRLFCILLHHAMHLPNQCSTRLICTTVYYFVSHFTYCTNSWGHFCFDAALWRASAVRPARAEFKSIWPQGE